MDEVKLYHWHIEKGGKTADYLCATAAGLEVARRVIITNIESPGGAEFVQAGHAGAMLEAEPFICGLDYPIVIW
jgi:hypothetical protein